MTTPLRGAAALAAAVTLSLTLAACAEDSTTPASDGAAAETSQVEEAHNDADVAFAQDMIPHHRQAVEMAGFAADRAEDPEVLALADEISAAQGPEIDTMTGFLEAWGEDVPAEDMAGMDHGGMAMDDMPGMMSEDDMSAMEDASGADFDRMFLESMIAHHEGAVQMAEAQLADGENPSAQALAQEIVDAQQAEIQRMQDLLEP